MTIDISKSLDDLLETLGRKDGFEEIDFLDQERFKSTDYGRFKILYDFSKHTYWTFILRLGKFLHLRYDMNPKFIDLKRTFENPLWLLIENAFKRGHKEDLTKTVEIECFYSPKGFVIIVRDQGDGFDVRDVVHKLERRERFWQDSGVTFFWMQEDKAKFLLIVIILKEMKLICFV